MEKLDWVERAAIENMKGRVANAELIHKEAQTILALLLSGGGAALYFAAKGTDLTPVALAVSFWLFAIAFLLTKNCLMFGNYPAVWNEPKNINDTDYDITVLRECELRLIQERIEEAARLNLTKSKRLNWCILGACGTPVFAAIAWAAWVYYFSVLGLAA